MKIYSAVQGSKLSKNFRSRDQFKKYETETRSLRDQDRDRQQKAETETGLEAFITGVDSLVIAAYDILKKISIGQQRDF